MASVIPLAKSLFLVDELLWDPKSKKVQLFNMFDAVRPPAGEGYPFRLGKLYVFAQLTGGVGLVIARVRVVDLAHEESPIFSGDYPLRFPTRKMIVNACFRLKDFVFPHAGEYLVELYCNDCFLDDRLLTLLSE